mgnify:CR=1 FL=1
MGKIAEVFSMVMIVPLACMCSTPDASTTSPPASGSEVFPEASLEDIEELSRGNSAFGLDMYHSLSGGEDNIFFSPFSISSALAMTFAGARGQTEEEMRQTLHFTLPGDTLHAAFGSLLRRLNPASDDDGEFALHTVNALWGQSGYEFLPGFLSLVSEYYRGDISMLDFGGEPERSRNTINEWVADQTEEKISDLLPPGSITTATRLVLTNAIYFNARWLFPFDPAATTRRPFTLLDGERLEVPAMSITETFRMMTGEGYGAVELPYRGTEGNMLLIVPDEGRFREIEERLDPELIRRTDASMRHVNLRLTLPKFTSTSRFSLEDALASMGMPSAFGPAADFSGMDGTRWLYISRVVHQAFVSVDEYGTEAAAATAVVMEKRNGGASAEFSVDRPFIYMIRDGATGTLLFMGRMLNPLE